MAISPTRCPAPVTAAAVLLIVVAGELLLAAGASGVYAVPNASSTLFTSAVAGFALCLWLAWLFLRAAIRALHGSLRSPNETGEYVTALGFIAGVIALFVTWVVVIVWERPGQTTADKVMLPVAGCVLAWANMTALFVAGFLFRKHTPRYFRWQKAIRRPPDEMGYEP